MENPTLLDESSGSLAAQRLEVEELAKAIKQPWVQYAMKGRAFRAEQRAMAREVFGKPLTDAEIFAELLIK